MPTTQQKIAIFFSSPNDIKIEREWFQEVISLINRGRGKSEDYILEQIHYTQMPSDIGSGSPQKVINNILSDRYDIYFGVMAHRFGTPTESGETGTESEFNNALNSNRVNKKPLISFFFKATPPEFSNTQDEESYIQMGAVVKFKKRVSTLGLITEYKTEEEFKLKCESSLYSHIDNILNNNSGISLINTNDNHYNHLKKHYLNGNLVEEKEGELKFPPYLIGEAGMEIVNHLKYSGFLTYYAKEKDFWAKGEANTNQYLEKIREKAREGKQITRIYILKNLKVLDQSPFIQSLKKDIDSSITTKIILQTDVKETHDFGLWDCFDASGNVRINDGIACFVELGVGGFANSCRFSCTTKNIERGIILKSDLLANPKLRDAAPIVNEFIQEKNKKIIPNSILHDAVLEMEDIAKEQCEGSYLPDSSDNNCKWYHSSWQYLRLLGMVSTPEWHHDFFSTQLSDAVKNKESDIRILISGLADFGMLAYIVNACLKHPDKRSIHIMDRCKTPLLMSHWYQKKIEYPGIIKTFQCDARETDIRDNHYDVIVTDAFLTRFNAADRKKVLSEWNRMLNPDGIVITTIRKRIDGGNIVKASAIEKENFGKKAKEKMAAWKNEHIYNSLLEKELTEEKIEEYAIDYAENMTTNKIGDKAAIKKEFEENNLNIITCEEIETPGEYGKTIYFQIVAQKKLISPDFVLTLSS